jgi:hypothetical protein
MPSGTRQWARSHAWAVGALPRLALGTSASVAHSGASIGRVLKAPDTTGSMRSACASALLDQSSRSSAAMGLADAALRARTASTYARICCA